MSSRILTLCVAFVAAASCQAQAKERVSIPQGRTVALADRAPIIKKGATPARIKEVLGTPAAQRDMGRPEKLHRELEETLQQVYTDPGELPQLQIDVDGKKLDLPLKHTHVKAEITGYVGRVEVTQTYQNPFDYPIEAIYIFPLPENSAVDDMKMVIGDRVIAADIKKRAEAREVYETAKAEGHTAALLEQERPNIFTQSVANIEPGTDIDVVVRYLQNLTYDDGGYEFVFPMVVGPRFIPGAPTGSRTGNGWSMDTDRVPDASRISPPVLGGGLRSGHDISIELVANAGLPITTWAVPTHDIDETPTYDGTLQLALKEDDSIPNRDFVLKYKVDGEQPTATVLNHHNGEEGFISLIIQPPELDIEDLVGKREIIFVVDVSGSMYGVPLSMCQDAMTQALRNLRPVDTFNLITFAGRTGQVFERARPANDSNIKMAMDYVNGLRAGGGTQMALGVQAALTPSVEEGRHRYVFFMTDGYIGNEKEIFDGTRKLVKALERKGQTARVFGFGVGSSVNRHLLDGIGKAGQGLTVYASTREDPQLAVNQFFRKIDHAVISNIEIDWGDVKVDQIFPTRMPDLFASRPFILHARYDGKQTGTVKIRGDAGGKRIELPVEVELKEDEKANASLSTLWARNKIGWLERDLWSGHSQQAVDAITELGIAHRIVTAYTSFVAVDRSKTVSGELKTVMQPVETPEGVSMEHAAPGLMVGGKKSKKMRRSYGGPAYGALGGSSGGSGIGYGRGAAGAPATRAMPRPKPPAPMKAMEAPVTASPEPEPSAYREDESRAEPKTGARGHIVVKGSLSAADIERVVRTARSRLKACHRSHGSGATQLELRWYVTATGKAIQFKVVSRTGKNDALEACLIRELGRLKFKAPRSGTGQVIYTFRFGS